MAVSARDRVDTITHVGWIGEVGVRDTRPVTPRRRWSEAEKRRIVAESYQPGVSVSVVARRNDVNANLVFNWRRRFREQGGFVPVVVEPAGMLPPPKDADADDAPATGRMEIALSDGSRVIVDREVDGAALGRVLSALGRR